MVVGSASIHTRRFVCGLIGVGLDVVVATDGDTGLGAQQGLCDVQLLDLGSRAWSASSRLLAMVQRWRPALIHVQQANSNVIHATLAALPAHIPVIVTFWGSDVLRLHEWNPIYRTLVRWALRRAAAWTADAHTLLDAAERTCAPHIPGLRCWIPIGIEPLTATAPVVRERRILSCRLHRPLYRVDSILRAFAGLPETLHDWVLEVAASGTETASLRELARELGLGARVEFSGMLDPVELARAYRRSAIFVSVPTSDGTAVSLLEAMAAGCLPVLSDLPANREWVEHRRNGLLVADPVDLAQVFLEAVDWWASGCWDAKPRLDNERLIATRAMFADSIRQFTALYDQILERTV